MKHTVSLKENYEFRRLYRSGKTAVDPHIAVYYKKNRKQHNRLGITATKKVGGAVQRNRARRLIKEAYRLLEPDIPTGLDIVVVARTRAVHANMQTIQKALRKTLCQGAPPRKGNDK